MSARRSAPTPTRRLREVAWVFLRLGATSFGGPAAHVAMMEDELVGRRRWLGREEFLDLLGATNLIPGPNSTEIALHVGRGRAGWPGLFVAGACFILPAAVIVLGIAWAYVRFGTLPQAEALLYGVKPIIIAIVLHALWTLARSAFRGFRNAAIALAAAAAHLLGVHELVLLLAAGLAMAGTQIILRPNRGAPVVLGLPMAALGGLAAVTPAPFGLGLLFLTFLKIGAVLFGSGYVLLAFLRADLVERLGWLSEAQLLDAVAAGQMTPGPVFTTATFIGYVIGGIPGAVVATAGIFLPAFVYVAVSGPLIPRLRRSPVAGAFLDGVIAASLALMAVVTWWLGRAAVVDAGSAVLGLAALALLLRFHVNPAWLIVGGAVAGLLARAVLTALP